MREPLTAPTTQPRALAYTVVTSGTPPSAIYMPVTVVGPTGVAEAIFCNKTNGDENTGNISYQIVVIPIN